jgi:hypothetical protein
LAVNGEQTMRPPGTLAPTSAQVSHLAQLRKATITELTRKERHDITDALAKTEHFVFTALTEANDPEVLESAKAMQEAGVWHLPFPVCTFEFDAEILVGGRRPYPEGTANRFILICRETDDQGPQADYMFIRATRHAWVRSPISQDDMSAKAVAAAERGEALVEFAIDTGKSHQHAGEIGANCLVMLATRGIRRERWSGDRPVLKNRTEPRDAYTKVLVREASEEQGHSDAHGGATDRCRVRLHLRRGHIRHQPVGPRSAGQTRMIWIAPMLVGYAEEGTIEHTHYERRSTPA